MRKLLWTLLIALGAMSLWACTVPEEPQQQAPQPVTVVNNLPVQGTSFSEMVLGIVVIVCLLAGLVTLVLLLANRLVRTTATTTASTVVELGRQQHQALPLPSVEAELPRPAIERRAR